MKFLSLALLLVTSSLFAQNSVHIGNSLTWDTRPNTLDDSDWYIYCSKNLDFIYNNPMDYCVSADGRTWEQALNESSYDFVVAQPFDGTTLAQDHFVLSEFIALQPQATIVIHSAWTVPSQFLQVYLSTDTSTMVPSIAYIETLGQMLQSSHPETDIRFTRANDILWQIHIDLLGGGSFYTSLTDVFRDFIHLDNCNGRYLMSQAIRHAMNEPQFIHQEHQHIPADELAYLDDVLHRVVVGDVNRDRQINLLDVQPFADVFASGVYDLSADCNMDGAVDLLDIQPFINLVD